MAVSALLGCAAGPAPGGAALYEGRADVDVRLRGHDERLPGFVWRCANCHVAGNGAVGAAPVAAPSLAASSLLTPQPRRGGPPSAYDADGFCRLMRTGVDPQNVLLFSAMPVYALSDSECLALWTHLIGARP